MDKRFFIIHGWKAFPEGCWRPWLGKHLESKGDKVSVPAMPNTIHPKADEWTGHISGIVGKPDESCFFVGHSLGCISILRYIESLPEDAKVGGIILVAGFTSNLGYDDLDSFFQTKIDWRKISGICKRVSVLHSDDDHFVSLHYGDIFKKHLNAKLVVMNNMGHFSDDRNITQLPILIELIDDMTT